MNQHRFKGFVLLYFFLFLCLILMLGCDSAEESIEFEDGTYVGEVKDGLPHGQGTLTWPDGTEYVGEFQDDLFHGQGTMTRSDGSVQTGRWEYDKYVGD